MRLKEKIALKLPLMALMICCFGCSGGGTDIDLGTVTGVVTMDGKPLANAIVVFAPEKGNPSTDQTDTNGNYEPTYNKNAKGAVLGKHKVSITMGEPPAAEVDPDADISQAAAETGIGFEEEANPNGKAAKKDPIPAKYNTQTELTADVKAGANTFDFKLDSK